MSLVCHECGHDLQPGNVFPGREGGILRPNFSVSVWPTTEAGWDNVFVEVPAGLALCFQCLVNISSVEKYQNFLRRVFFTYNTEVDLKRLIEQAGGMVLGGGNGPEQKRLNDILAKLYKMLFTPSCCCCDGLLPSGQNPFFTFWVMDRVYAERRLSFYGSYQWRLTELFRWSKQGPPWPIVSTAVGGGCRRSRRT